MYRYGVSTLPVHWRLLAHLVGFGGSRELGLRMVEEAASYPADARPDALFTLIVMYSREERYDAVLRVVGQLQREYPRNRLLWLEAGSTALRAGRAGEARGRAHKELGKLADLSGDRSGAVEEYRLAIRLCRADADTVCLEEAKHLMVTQYR